LLAIFLSFRDPTKIFGTGSLAGVSGVLHEIRGAGGKI
jgi:hypothetical protein